MSCSRSCSRSEPRLQQGEGTGNAVQWLASRHGKYAVLCVDADKLAQDLLQRAIGTANYMLNAGNGLLKYLMPFPHHLDGGFPAIHPQEVCILYAQIRDGRLAGLTAAATGGNRKTRERGLGMVAAAVQRDDVLGDSDVHHDLDLVELVVAAKVKLAKLAYQQPHGAKPIEGLGPPPRWKRHGDTVSELNEMLEEERAARDKLEKDNAELRARLDAALRIAQELRDGTF